MLYQSIFDQPTTDQLFKRIDSIHSETNRSWGKMSPAQMFAHCCIPYEVLAREKDNSIPLIFKIIGPLFFKSMLTNEVNYPKNARTAKQFIVADDRNIEIEKERLKNYILLFHSKGIQFFEGKKHNMLGSLTSKQWSNMLYKHLDHHLRQFNA